MTSSVAVKFLGHVSSDPYLNDQDVRVVVGILPRMTADGRWRGTDEDLADDTDQAPTSLHASLTRLSDRGYLAPLVRKSYGERDLTLGPRYLKGNVLRLTPTLRPSKASAGVGEAVVTPAEETLGEGLAEETLGEALAEETLARPRRRKAHRNSAPQQNCENKETPHSEETLTRGRAVPRGGAGKETLRSSESLNSRSLSSTEKHSLADLAEQYGVAHFPIDVIQAADAFEDLAGSAHYNMVYTTMASSDQDVWAEAVLVVLTRWRADEIASPRPYIATTVQGILAERKKVISDRERLEKMGLSRKTPVVPPQARTEEEVDALILLDPFVDSPIEDAEFQAPGEDTADPLRQAPAEQHPDQPEETSPDAGLVPVEAPTPVVEANPAIREAAPAPAARLRPFGAKKPAVKIEANEDAVLKARERLGPWAKVDFLRSLYTGACGNRGEVFDLVISVAERDEVTSNAFLLRVANLHVADDAHLLRDLAAGKTTAECTVALVEFESRLQAEKNASNRPMTKTGGYRSDTPAGLGAVLDTLPLDKGGPRGVGPALPTTPRGWADQADAMTAMRGAYGSLSEADRQACDRVGVDLACQQVDRDNLWWDNWRQLGTYHAVCVLTDAATREENVRVSREPISVATPPRG